jgi:hypothetical protein
MRLQSSSTIGVSSGLAFAMADVTKEAMVKEVVDKRVTEEATMKEAADKEVARKRATEEVMMKDVVGKEATDKRIVEEATVKEATNKEAADKRAVEEAVTKEVTMGATGGSLTSGQVPSSVAGTKRAATSSGSTPPAKRPYRGVGKPRFVQFSCTPLFHLAARFNSEKIFFLHSSSSSSTSPTPKASSAAIAVSSMTPTVGTTTLAATVKAALELAVGDMPQTLEGVPEDVLEESEEEPEMVSKPVPEVVLEVVPVEGAMIITHSTAPSPPHGAAEASLLAPCSGL